MAGRRCGCAVCVCMMRSDMVDRQQIEISVVIPFYNAEKFIGDTLESILDQTFHRFEVILVDDGSTDGGADVVEKIAGRDSRIRLIRRENRGAGAARNYGTALATGKYIIYLDADDLFEKTMFEVMYNEAESSDAEICVCQAVGFDSNSGETIRNFRSADKCAPGVYRTSALYPRIFQIFYGHPWDKLILRDLIIRNDLSFQNIKKSNDNYFIYSALLKSKSISILDQTLVRYRCESGSSIQDATNRNNQCILTAVEALNKQEWIPDEARKSLSIWSFESFLRAFGLSAGDVEVSRQIYERYKKELGETHEALAKGIEGAGLLTRFKYWCFSRMSFEALRSVYAGRTTERYQKKWRKAYLAFKMFVFALLRK